jgi:hypothetical protein
MRRLLQPSLLLIASLALAVAAAYLIFWTPVQDARAEPRPVRPGDREIVFLYQATSAATWERFVSAAERSAKNSAGKLILDEVEAFPRQTTAVPEFTLTPVSGEGRLIFRWYKLTGSQKVGDWVNALFRRSPPPLAFIGGNTSDAAGELARELRAAAKGLTPARAPLLLLTTATADRVVGREDAAEQLPGAGDLPGQSLTEIYEGRTFRFCFTNRRMADVVVDFLWHRDDLRPNPDPVYKVYWQDDSFSEDLKTQFELAVYRTRLVEAAAQDLGNLLGSFASSSIPWLCPRVNRVLSPASLPSYNVASSVGTFIRPNRQEWDAVDWLMQDFRPPEPTARRPQPVLFLSGQSKPSRRFLRGLEEYDHVRARRFVVACGDSLAFNTVYRDRDVAWPIQDLPFNLIFFCHRNPVDAEAGFHPDRRGEVRDGPAATTGTEDLLLFQDIIAALVEAASGRGADDPATVCERLRAVRMAGKALFKPDGNRNDGTGEHIVWLRPRFAGDRVLPEADLSVWTRQGENETVGLWHSVAELELTYEGSPRAGGGSHAGN